MVDKEQTNSDMEVASQKQKERNQIRILCGECGTYYHWDIEFDFDDYAIAVNQTPASANKCCPLCHSQKVAEHAHHSGDWFNAAVTGDYRSTPRYSNGLGSVLEPLLAISCFPAAVSKSENYLMGKGPLELHARCERCGVVGVKEKIQHIFPRIQLPAGFKFIQFENSEILLCEQCQHILEKIEESIDMLIDMKHKEFLNAPNRNNP